MKGVVLAAGRGTRLGGLTATTPKGLLDVGRRPVIVRILDGLMSAGVTEVMVVTGHLGEQLERELGSGESSGLPIRYARQETLDGTARGLLLAREWLGDERFFFSWGDILVRPQNYRAVVKAARLRDGAIAVNEVEDPWAGAAVYVDEDWLVSRMVEKPPRGASSTRWNNAGFGVLGPAIWPAIEALEPSAAGEYELPRAIAAIIAEGARIAAVPVEGGWFDVGTPEQLAAARLAWGP